MEMLLILLVVTVCDCDEATINSPIQYVWSPYTGYVLQPQYLERISTGNVQGYYGNTASQEYRFDTGYHSVNNINLQNLNAQLGLEGDRESKMLHIDETVEGICQNEGRKIMAVWRVVTELLDLNNDHKIGNLEEVKRLSLIIKTFLALSKKKDFNRMSIRQILATIQEHLDDDNLSREILDKNPKLEVDVFVKDLENTDGHNNVHFNKNFDIHQSEINLINNIGIEEDAALIENLEILNKQNDHIVNGPPDLLKTIILQQSKLVSSPGALNIPSNLELDKDTNSKLIETNIQMEKILADVSNSNVHTFEEIKLDKDERIPYIMAIESGTNVLTGELPFNEVSKISSLLVSTEPNTKAVLIHVSPNIPPIRPSNFTSETIAGSLIKEASETVSPSKSNFKALLIELSSNTPYTLHSEHISESHAESLFDKVPKIPSLFETDVRDSIELVGIENVTSSPATIVFEYLLTVERPKIPVVTPLEHIADGIKSLSIKENAGISSIFGVNHTSEPHVKAVIIEETSNSLASGHTSESNRFLINESTKHLISTPIVSVIDNKAIDEISKTKFKPILIELSTREPSLASDHISESHRESLSFNEAVTIAADNSGIKEILITEFNNEPSFKSQLEALTHETITTSIHTPSESHMKADIIEVPANKPILSSGYISDFESMFVKENDKLSSMFGSVNFPESNIKTIIIEQSTTGHTSDKSESHTESSLIKQFLIPADRHSENSLTVNISDDSDSVPILPHPNNHSGKIVQSHDTVQQINSVSIWQEIVSRYGSCKSSRSSALLIEIKALLDALEMDECVFVQSQKTIRI